MHTTCSASASQKESLPVAHLLAGGADTPPLTTRARNLLLSVLIFIVLVVLALVLLPPLADTRDTAIRTDLD
jgi:hypothetical protein